MKKLRIAMVCHELNQGGGVASYINNTNEKLIACDEIQSVRIIETTKYKGILKLIHFTSVIILVLFLSVTRQVDIFHIHMSSRGSTLRKIIISSICFISRTPYIVHIHSGEYPSFYLKELNKYGKTVVKFFLRKAQFVVVLGHIWKEWFSNNLNLENLITLYNAIPDISVNHTISDKRETIVFVGRLTTKKGILDLISAFNIISLSRPMCELIIIGNDGDIVDIEASIGISARPRITFHGWLNSDECHSLIGKCSLLVLPSYYEGLPICILEAMCLSKPVVATSVGAIPEVITNGIEGIIIPPGNVSCLVNAINSILENKVLKENMGVRARARYEALFNIEEHTSKLTRIYSTTKTSE
ncbi:MULTISPECIES: glycosyltransferase family 4 protein [Pseudomonas]|mgnify:CR=1 FL=1|uniref:Glycosyl transferase family 1 domain-containing protein n=1 Tax=Pseudomonas azotoformans TaxID=47878 RepID=A0A4Q0HC97_PSEAZ|nr:MULTISPECIES: glycosyltransferase family 4 protein [Pseudomonas]RXE46247.1 hypothetical protein B4O85_28900 [Pseudomonas azotoformans]